VRATPVNQLVLETDSPYLTPVPYRGRVNTPRYLPLIAEKIAALKNLDIEAFLEIVRVNSHALFFEEA
jgi:TatD DNase family protein